jgi:putative transposase
MQKNVLDTRRWETREQLRLAIVTWIETKYNRRRRQRAQGKLTPVEFEKTYTTANAASKPSTPNDLTYMLGSSSGGESQA